jgi:hypothetical protein
MVFEKLEVFSEVFAGFGFQRRRELNGFGFDDVDGTGEETGDENARGPDIGGHVLKDFAAGVGFNAAGHVHALGAGNGLVDDLAAGDLIVDC